jgi:hypothetical protein
VLAVARAIIGGQPSPQPLMLVLGDGRWRATLSQ